METVKKQPEVADILRLYGDDYKRNRSLPHIHNKIINHIKTCRTSQLGGHVEGCSECGFEKIAYNSCRDRHCPKCQTMVKEKWINDRKAELLPCGYFHLVFTLPHDLNPIVLCNKAVMMAILFASVNETLQAFAKDPQWRLEGQLGFVAVLHTWNQVLLDHLHLHCLIPAGALSFDKKRWIPTRGSFLFRIKSLAKEFRKRYLHKTETAFRNNKLIFPGKTSIHETRDGFMQLIQSLSKTTWIAYAKRPFAGPEQVLEYLGRYTHRVAISNNRIKNIDNGNISFTYRDRSKNNNLKKMTLVADEFIRRFLLHSLPKGFRKIRYFGFLANTNKKKCIPILRGIICPDMVLPDKIDETVQELMLRLTGIDITLCPKCKQGKMKPIRTLPQLVWNSS